MTEPFFDLGLAVIRVAVGGILLAHGLQKFGYLGGHGLDGTAGFFEGGLQFRPGMFWASVVALVETIGGIMVLIGFLGPIAPLAIAADMFVATLVVHRPKGFWITDGGMEFTLALGAAALGLAFTGYGALSADALLGLVMPAWLLPAWLIATAAGAATALAIRASSTGATEA